jgi:TDG/mug DNA glycosylase family protein
MSLPDVIGPNLKMLFCKINPGLLAAAIGHHCAGRGGSGGWSICPASQMHHKLLHPGNGS